MFKKIFSILFFVSAAILFSGCVEIAFAPSIDQPINRTWQKIDDSLARMELFYTKDESTESIHIYRITPGTYRISIVNSTDEPKYISDWASELEDVNIVINGAYFHEDYSPSGYLKIDFNRVGERIFDQNQSGLIQIENGLLSIRDLSIYPLKEGEEVEYGLQSYPFIIKDSVRAIKEDSGKEARRTAIGIDKDDYIYIILVDDHHMSLYDLMVELIKSEVELTHVLNIDGGPSSGISINYEGYEELNDSLVKVPSVIVFSKI